MNPNARLRDRFRAEIIGVLLLKCLLLWALWYVASGRMTGERGDRGKGNVEDRLFGHLQTQTAPLLSGDKP